MKSMVHDLAWNQALACLLSSATLVLTGSVLCRPPVSLAETGPVTTKITETTGAGDLGTKIIQGDRIYNITHGTPTGSNLFHSFKDFSLASGDTARFQTTTLTPDTTVQNILGRVTGGNLSHLFGTIDSATFYPQASLFLMNPAGIIFGPSATLNVGGSVAFTTAHYLRLAEANGSHPGIFSANPTHSNILTSTPVEAFGFLDTHATPIKPINVDGSGLSIPAEKSLVLVGGNISISSGALINAPSGQIQIVSTASAGELLTSPTTNVPSIQHNSFSKLGNIDINESTLDVSNSNNGGNGGVGTISIRAGQLAIKQSSVSANVLEGGNGAQTVIDINVTKEIHLENASTIMGQGGNISITAQDLTLSGGSTVTSFNSGKSVSGNISIDVTDSIHILGSDPQFGTGSSVQSVIIGSKQGGNLIVKADHLTVENGGNISTIALGGGRAGDLTIDIGNSLKIGNGGTVVSNGNGSAGHIAIEATEVIVSGHDNSGQRSRIESRSDGAGGTGSLDIHAKTFLLSNDARLNMAGAGKLGNLTIKADDSIQISNGGKIRMENNAGAGGLIHLDSPKITLEQGIIQTLTIGEGTAGSVSMNAGDILIDGGKVDGSTCFNACGERGGLGGNIELNASNQVVIHGQLAERTVGTEIEAAGPAGIFSATGNAGKKAGDIYVSAPTFTVSDGAIITSQTSGSGHAGNILIKANDVSITGGAKITAESTGSGNAGTVTIQGLHSPANTFLLEGPGSGILTSTTKTGAGGNILIDAKDVWLRHGGKVSAETSGTTTSATGGTIKIQGDRVRIENGALVTASTTGAARSGSIRLEAGQSVSINNGAMISASSTGSGDAGNVSIHAGQRFEMQNSSVTTSASQATGGNIDIQATDLVRVVNGQISTSVLGGSGNGGNISIDPNTVILQNSQIVAKAVNGAGGNITITTPLFLADQSSLVNASSQFGLNGTVTIQSPTSNLSGTIGQLSSKPSPIHLLVQNRCAALADGQQSTFILSGRQSSHTTPGGWTPSPFTTLATETLAMNEDSPPPVNLENTGLLSLRSLTPPGFFVQSLVPQESTDCRF